MPEYAWLLESPAEFDAIPQRMRGMQMLGVPYKDDQIAGGIEAACKQADEIVAKLTESDSSEKENLRDKKIIALIAYLDRLGRDITQPTPVDKPAPTATAQARTP